MNDIDKFIETRLYGGGGRCSDIEYFDNNIGTGYGTCDSYTGFGDYYSNGDWNGNGNGRGQSHSLCFIVKENLYGYHR